MLLYMKGNEMVNDQRRSDKPRKNAAKPRDDNRAVAFYLDTKDINLVDEAAEEYNLNRSAMIRKIIQNFFA